MLTPMHLFKKKYHVGLHIRSEGFDLAVLDTRKNTVLFEENHIWQSKRHFESELKEVVLRYQLQNAHTTLILPSEDYQILFVEKPQVSSGEMKDALKWVVASEIEADPTDYVIDYIECPQVFTDKKARLYVIFAKKNSIEDWLYRVQSADLRVKKIDICQSILREFAVRVENQDECQSLLYIDKTSSNMLIFKNKLVWMIREIPIGSMALTGNTKIRELGIEMQRSFDFYSSQLNNEKVVRLIVMSSSDVHTLIPTLSDLLNLPVRECHAENFVQSTSSHQDETSVLAVGAALGGSR